MCCRERVGGISSCVAWGEVEGIHCVMGRWTARGLQARLFGSCRRHGFPPEQSEGGWRAAHLPPHPSRPFGDRPMGFHGPEGERRFRNVGPPWGREGERGCGGEWPRGTPQAPPTHPRNSWEPPQARPLTMPPRLSLVPRHTRCSPFISSAAFPSTLTTLPPHP